MFLCLNNRTINEKYIIQVFKRNEDSDVLIIHLSNGTTVIVDKNKEKESYDRLEKWEKYQLDNFENKRLNNFKAKTKGE